MTIGHLMASVNSDSYWEIGLKMRQ